MNLLFFLILFPVYAQLDIPKVEVANDCSKLKVPTLCDCVAETSVIRVSCSCQKIWDENKQFLKSSLRFLKNNDCLSFYYNGCAPKKLEGTPNLCEKLNVKKSELAEVYSELAGCLRVPRFCPEGTIQRCSESSGNFTISCTGTSQSQILYSLIQ